MMKWAHRVGERARRSRGARGSGSETAAWSRRSVVLGLLIVGCATAEPVTSLGTGGVEGNAGVGGRYPGSGGTPATWAGGGSGGSVAPAAGGVGGSGADSAGSGGASGTASGTGSGGQPPASGSGGVPHSGGAPNAAGASSGGSTALDSCGFDEDPSSGSEGGASASEGGAGGVDGLAGGAGSEGAAGAATAGAAGSVGTAGGAGASGAAGSAGSDTGPSLVVQYRRPDRSACDNQIRAHLRVVNRGPAPVPLDRITLRYYFSSDQGTPEFVAFCDYAVLGCARLHYARIAPSDSGTSHYYLEVGFTKAAGTLRPGADTGEIQLRLAQADWANFDEYDDYSYDRQGHLAFGDWARVPLYSGSILTWGTPP